jgi:hypothetical protein
MRFAHLKIHHGSERMRLRGLSGARDEFHLAAFSPQQPSSTPENSASRRNDYRDKSLDRNTTGRSTWNSSSKNFRDTRSSITSRNRMN